MPTVPAPTDFEGIAKQEGYAVLHNGAMVDSRGYAILASGAQIPASVSYAVLSDAAAISTITSYAVISNPASILASAAYAVHHFPASIIAAPAYAVLVPLYPPYEDIPIDVDFVEERFPECVSFGSSGGPGFKTSVFEFDSGFTASMIEWDRLRARYDVTFENATPTDIEQVEEFFYGMRGQALGFRYKDWSDYQITQQNVLVGDGDKDRFQIFKRYTSGGHTFDRIIKKPVANTMEFTLNGAVQLENGDYFINYTTGEIIFPSAPPVGAVGYITYMEFDVPVRFASDELDVTYNDFRQLKINSIPMIEILL
jgi:uncharacterized protein (TIGR02217 family)